MLEFKDYLNGNHKEPIVVLGGGLVGSIFSNYINKSTDIKIKFIVDGNPVKQNKKLNGADVVSYDYLDSIEKTTPIFIAHRYIDSAISTLKNKKLSNVYIIRDLITEIDPNKFYEGELVEIKRDRLLNYFVQMADKAKYLKKDILHLKSIDIQVSEKCSLKCKDCCNLMQYYEKPKDVETEVLLKSIEKFMSCIDSLDEFRVLGGDPFMNKELHKVMSKLATYDKCKKIVVYTNARFLPKNDNLEVLKHPKVILEITDYGKKDSKAADQFVEMAKKENIAYQRSLVSEWEDGGTIMPFISRSQSDLKSLFSNCCQADLITLLHGKLYRCPFSANGANLNAFPFNAKDEVNLLDEKLSIQELRKQIKNLCFEKEYLTACSYCKGRTFESEKIKAAVQIKEPLNYSKLS